MKLVVLGSNGFRPNDLGHTACYAIPELGLTLDAGTGLYRMVDYLEDDRFDVYLSHDHPDHTWGLAYVWSIFWRKMTREAMARDGRADVGSIFASLGKSPPRVRVHLAPEQVPNVQYLLQKFRDHILIEYVPLKSTEELTYGTRITSFPVAHRKDELCFGFHVDTPSGSLAYVTDTYGEPGASYADNIRGVDVLLHECSVLDNDSEFARQVGHSHITPVAQLAAEARVGRLILIHLSSFRPEHGEPELDRAHPIFPRTEVAYDGMEIEF
jgi:ribonuclease BN (tRNA processing enzyme)